MTNMTEVGLKTWIWNTMAEDKRNGFRFALPTNVEQD